MSFYLRIIIFIAAVVQFVFISRKLRKSQLRLMDAFYWIVFSTLLIILAAFPKIGIYLADVIGVVSAANFIFLIIIFLLILKNFVLNIRISTLESKVSNLAQEIAIRKNMDNAND